MWGMILKLKTAEGLEMDMIINCIYIQILCESDLYGVFLMCFWNVNTILKRQTDSRIFIWPLPKAQRTGMSNPAQRKKKETATHFFQASETLATELHMLDKKKKYHRPISVVKKDKFLIQYFKKISRTGNNM